MKEPQITTTRARTASALPWIVREDQTIIARFRAEQDAHAFADMCREAIADAAPHWNDQPGDDDHDAS